eukprot:3318149-Rhodomonas_salina.1
MDPSAFRETAGFRVLFRGGNGQPCCQQFGEGQRDFFLLLLLGAMGESSRSEVKEARAKEGVK